MLGKYCPDCQSQGFIWMWIFPFINSPGDCSITLQKLAVSPTLIIPGYWHWDVYLGSRNTDKLKHREKEIVSGWPKSCSMHFRENIECTEPLPHRGLGCFWNAIVQFNLSWKWKVSILFQNNWAATASDSGAVLHPAQLSFTQLSCSWVRNGMISYRRSS